MKDTVKQEQPDQNASVLGLIGGTPLIRLRRITEGLAGGVRIYAKLERGNPGGSVKDRAACHMITEAEARGLLKRNMIILDSSSGNTGIAYAMIGAVKGYRVRVVLPETAGIERKKIMQSFGAELVFSSPFEGADGAILMAKEIMAENPDRYFQPDQYNNPLNAKAHELTTGPEIISQTQGSISHFIACVGTGGTIMGTGRALKSFNPAIRILSVHPDSSMHGIEGVKYLEEGAIVPGIFDKEFPDERLTASTEAAYDVTKRLAREEGLFVGHSSGAALSATLQVAEQLEEAVIVVMFPDGGERYLSRDI